MHPGGKPLEFSPDFARARWPLTGDGSEKAQDQSSEGWWRTPLRQVSDSALACRPVGNAPASTELIEHGSQTEEVGGNTRRFTSRHLGGGVAGCSPVTRDIAAEQRR